MNRHLQNTLGLLASVATLLGISTVPAFAAPELSLTLERDSVSFPTVYHSDERIDFTVKVKNVAPALLGALGEGDPLACVTRSNESNWLSSLTINYSFEFQWVRDGVPITSWAPATRVLGAGGLDSTYISSYAVQPADAEHAIQCLVKGTNGAGTGSYVVASQPAVVADPQPAVAPPTPDDPVAANRRPAISGDAKNAGEKLKCTAPDAGWSNANAASPITWSFEWLRDGQPAPGTVIPVSGTESEYQLTAADVSAPEAPAAFQCIARATNAGGHTAVVESFAVSTTSPAPAFVSGSEGGFPRAAFGAVPTVERNANTIVEPVTVEVELPMGENTFAYQTEPQSWACDEVPAAGAEAARVICSYEDLISPEDESPTLKVVTALGNDAPDVAVARATAFGGGAASVSKQLTFQIEPAIPFGLSKFTAALVDEAGNDYTQAGGHPFAGVSELVVNQKRSLVESPYSRSLPIEDVRQVIVDVPRGVVGNQLAVPELCPGVEAVKESKCPPGSAIGVIVLQLFDIVDITTPIYAVEPEFGLPAMFAFTDGDNVYTFSPRLRADDNYAVSLELSPAAQVAFRESAVTLCDFGAKLTSGGGVAGCKQRGEPGANPKPLFTNPTRCDVPLVTRIRVSSWEHRTFIEGTPFANKEITGCEEVPFEPTAKFEPTSNQADSPTGLDVELSMPTEGLEKVTGCHEKQGDDTSPLAPDCISQSHLKEAKVTLPQSMAINPTAGQGLGACSAEQIKIGTNDPISCPDSSKIGTVEIKTPVLEDILKGGVYIAEQGEVEGSLIGFYMVFDSPKNGILVKLPAKVTPDPNTGRLTVTVAESPEQPFSEVRMHFPGGPRATLLTPPKCGTYQIVSELTPWSGGAAVIRTSSFEVTSGPGGGPCPNGGLDAALSAGSARPLAGQTSPFNVRLSRPDGSDRFTALGLRMPPGLTAYLRGVPYCPEAAIAQAKSREGEGQGLTEIISPSCPAASQIGRVIAGAGAGDNPLYVDTGRAYLAGPYKGAPLSIVVIAPAVAGPLDLGNVVVRNALHIQPETAQVNVVSDPIPTIKHGILLDVRDVRVSIDREHFTLNPTSCEPKQVQATVAGLSGATASLANHFQVDGCGALKFGPKIFTRLFGGTKRGGHPKFRGVVVAKEGEANIGRTAVTLPRSEFLDQGNIARICTRVQFAADACPKGAIYGHARAFTPLLDYAVEGPVYLRSSDNKLPDLVAVLRGPDHQPIEAHLVGRIDSIRGGIRTTFENPPDVPIGKFILTMQGGKKKGLLVNSSDVCARNYRSTVKMRGQNGKLHSPRPVLRNGKCAKQSKRDARR